MSIRKTYCVASLALLLSFSLALPYCCHADISEVFSHQTEMVAHVAHGQHSDTNADTCDCGHELVKDFQKNKKVATGQNVFPLFTGISTQAFTLRLFDKQTLHWVTTQPGILADSGPPLHLLNNVFLN